MTSYKFDTKWPEGLQGSWRLPGIKVPGPTCYAKATLQVINHTPELVNYFVNSTCDCEKDGCYQCLMKEHAEQLISCQRKKHLVQPEKLLQAVFRDSRELKKGKKGDADELLMHLAAKLEDRNKKSVVEEVFNTKTATLLKCKSCGWEKRQVLDCNLTLDKGDVTEMLREWRKEKECDVKRTCDKCGEKRDFTEKNVIDASPHVLKIRLVDYFGAKKTTSFPAKISIGPYMGNDSASDEVYELYAVVVFRRNHFFAHCRDPSGEWNTYESKKFMKSSLEDVLKSDPYSLYYRKAPGKKDDVSRSTM